VDAGILVLIVVLTALFGSAAGLLYAALSEDRRLRRLWIMAAPPIMAIAIGIAFAAPTQGPPPPRAWLNDVLLAIDGFAAIIPLCLLPYMRGVRVLTMGVGVGLAIVTLASTSISGMSIHNSWL